MNIGAEATACETVKSRAIRAIGWGPVVMANNGSHSPRHKEDQVRDLSPYIALACCKQIRPFCRVSALWTVACLRWCSRGDQLSWEPRSVCWARGCFRNPSDKLLAGCESVLPNSFMHV